MPPEEPHEARQRDSELICPTIDPPNGEAKRPRFVDYLCSTEMCVRERSFVGELDTVRGGEDGLGDVRPPVVFDPVARRRLETVLVEERCFPRRSASAIAVSTADGSVRSRRAKRRTYSVVG